MRPSWCPPLIFKTFSWGLFGHPRSLQGGEKVPSWLLRARGRPQNRSTAFLQWIMAPWALPPCKNAVNLAVARDPVKNKVIRACGHRRGTLGRPSDDLEASKNFFTKPLKSQGFSEWRPDGCTHYPRPLRVASRRLRMQKSVFSKMLVFLKEKYVF